MPSMWRETKSFTAQIASGSTTSNSFNLGGYAQVGIIVPVIASGYLAFNVAPSGSPVQPGMTATDGPYSPLLDKAAALISAATPGGTGGVAIDSNFLLALGGYNGPVRISAATAQTANAVFWIHLKG